MSIRPNWIAGSIVAAVVATGCSCGEPEPEPTDGGMDDGGMDDGGMDDGGMDDAGMTDGGMTDAGMTDGGMTDAGMTDAGMTDAGMTDAGVDCATATDGERCGAGAICLGGVCGASVCGDGFVDDPSEMCDDGNDVEDDGCTGCANDCTLDADCADTDLCNGTETCDPATHTCDVGTPVVCDDANACTADSCALGACTNALMDGDRDGYAPTSLGACGTDCDDTSASVHPGALELCDATDQNCDGVPFPPGAQTWYYDCDNDDYAPAGASSMIACTRPGASCGPSGGWTLRAPIGSAIDCNDGVGAIRPGATELRGDNVDQDCNGGELCFGDGDNDAYYVDTTVASSDTDCSDSGEGAATEMPGDCDDGNADIRPNVAERRADGVDQNCDGDEDCYADADSDGYRFDATVASADLDCEDVGEGSATDIAGDCNDLAMSVHPGAFELCNATDEDCNGSATNTCPSTMITYGPSTVNMSYGGMSGTGGTMGCPTGYAVSGFWGQSGAVVDQLSVFCRRYTFAQTASVPEYRYRISSSMSTEMLTGISLGGNGGGSFIGRCTDGSVVTGISGRAGATIDQFAFRCTDIEAVRASMTSTTWVPTVGAGATVGPYGGTGGTAFTSNCPPGHVVRSVSGTTFGVYVESVAIRCAALQVVPQ